jgi:hypothetical protein
MAGCAVVPPTAGQNFDGVVMRALAKVNGEQRARVSDELRQLKQMSKGLRTKAMRALIERHGAKRLDAKRLDAKSVVLPAKAPPSVAA